jgi:signal transduction histidine kinase
MNGVNFTQVLDAAAYALVTERCRQAYIHDIRDGLQALAAAIELLARSAKAPENPVLLEKAHAIAKRAMATHEQSLVELMQRMAPNDEPATRVNLGEVVHEALRILRNDAIAKSITFRSALAPDMFIAAQAHRCHLLILGLNAMAIDALPSGSSIDVTLVSTGSHALLEFKSALRYSRLPMPTDFGPGRPAMPPHELLLALTSQWVGLNEGRIELEDGDLSNALRIYHPLHQRST